MTIGTGAAAIIAAGITLGMTATGAMAGAGPTDMVGVGLTDMAGATIGAGLTAAVMPIMATPERHVTPSPKVRIAVAERHQQALAARAAATIRLARVA